MNKSRVDDIIDQVLEAKFPTVNKWGDSICKMTWQKAQQEIYSSGVTSSSSVGYDKQETAWRALASQHNLSLDELAACLADIFDIPTECFPGIEGLAELTDNQDLMKGHDYFGKGKDMDELRSVQQTAIHSYIYGGRRMQLARQAGLLDPAHLAWELSEWLLMLQSVYTIHRMGDHKVLVDWADPNNARSNFSSNRQDLWDEINSIGAPFHLANPVGSNLWIIEVR